MESGTLRACGCWLRAGLCGVPLPQVSLSFLVSLQSFLIELPLATIMTCYGFCVQIWVCICLRVDCMWSLVGRLPPECVFVCMQLIGSKPGCCVQICELSSVFRFAFKFGLMLICVWILISGWLCASVVDWLWAWLLRSDLRSQICV